MSSAEEDPNHDVDSDDSSDLSSLGDADNVVTDRVVSSGSSDEEDFAFEESFAPDDQTSTKEEGKRGDKNLRIVHNKEYDEALDVTGSTIESHGVLHDEEEAGEEEVAERASRRKRHSPNQKSLAVQDASYDEALEVSASTMDSIDTPSRLNKMSTSALATKTESPKTRTRIVTGLGEEEGNADNRPWDEAHSVSSDGEKSLDTEDGLGLSGSMKRHKLLDSMGKNGHRGGDSPPLGTNSSFDMQEYGDEKSDAGSKNATPKGAKKKNEKLVPLGGDGELRGGSERDSVHDDKDAKAIGSDDESTVRSFPKGYRPEAYENLKVSDEIKDLFKYIGRYEPPRVELETRLRCFVPEYVPALGEIDAFVKIPRPDNVPDDLGLSVIDEPAAHQSDATVLELQLRSTSKKANLGAMKVRSIDRPDKNPKEITKWIESIENLHRHRPPPKVHYTSNMPDIDRLMEAWPAEFETFLRNSELPSAAMDMSTEEYARVVCGLLDIPVQKSLVESLHVLFTLFTEFRDNEHFQNAAGGSEVAVASPSSTGDFGTPMGSSQVSSKLSLGK